MSVSWFLAMLGRGVENLVACLQTTLVNFRNKHIMLRYINLWFKESVRIAPMQILVRIRTIPSRPKQIFSFQGCLLYFEQKLFFFTFVNHASFNLLSKTPWRVVVFTPFTKAQIVWVSVGWQVNLSDKCLSVYLNGWSLNICCALLVFDCVLKCYQPW